MMSTQEEYCLAPRGMKKFTNVSNKSILRPSIYQKVKKTKIKTSNKLNKESHLTHYTNLTSLNPKQKSKKTKGLTFHFFGIPANKLNKSHKTTLKFDDIDINSIVTIKSSLKTSDNILKLKEFIHKTFNIPIIYNILIFYSHLIISTDNNSKLNAFGITNKSLLLLAISPTINIFENNKNINTFNEQKSNHKFEIKCMKGFDIITQQSDVNVYRMPNCNHVMSKYSLYQYTLTHFKNKNNLHLQCPHPYECKNEMDEKYETNDWQCMRCTYINIENDIECVICGNLKDMKQWKCSRCTFINNEEYKQCQICEHYKDINDNNINIEPKQLYCNKIWDYSLIKRILMTKDDKNVINDKRQILVNKYYSFRYKYSKLKHENKNITLELQIEIRKIQKQLIKEFNMNDKKDLNKIRKKAKKDVIKNKFAYPKCENNKIKWNEYTTKLELLSARNNIQNKYNLQKCPKCNALYYKNKINENNNKPKSMKQLKKYETECVTCDNITSFCF
eukprot:11318_1